MLITIALPKDANKYLENNFNGLDSVIDIYLPPTKRKRSNKTLGAPSILSDRCNCDYKSSDDTIIIAYINFNSIFYKSLILL